MRTGLTKKQKTTVIYFDEHSRIIDEQGGLTFEIEKGRLSFRLTAPYSEERRKAASYAAKQNCVHKRLRTCIRMSITFSKNLRQLLYHGQFRFWIYAKTR